MLLPLGTFPKAVAPEVLHVRFLTVVLTDVTFNLALLQFYLEKYGTLNEYEKRQWHRWYSSWHRIALIGRIRLEHCQQLKPHTKKV